MNKGLFVEELDWNDPQYEPWNIEKLGELNHAQLDALLDDDDVDLPKLTENERIDLCLTVPCRVELGRSNVCTGVERSWPKRMFGIPNFNDLEPKQKRCIYRDMERKALLLYNTYVDENRLKERVRRRTANAHAPYWEQRYRKHRFLRIKALADQGECGTNAESVDDGMVNAELTDDDSDNDKLVIDESVAESSLDNSEVTVINTGSTQPDKSVGKGGYRKESSQIDVNDNNYNMDNDDDDDDDGVIDYMENDENISNNSAASGRSIHSQKTTSLPKRSDLNKRQPLKVQQNGVRISATLQQTIVTLNSDDEEDVSEEEEEADIQYNDILSSQSFVTSTVPDDLASPDRPSQDLNLSPVEPCIDYSDPTRTLFTRGVIVSMRNLGKHMVSNDVTVSSQHDETTEVDSLDFLTPNMMGAQTSTQQ
ncbi:dual specificity protein kinase splB-like [Sitodiplosis mosellana]|uniref:dual specificity protein kinase splB-like n=1 Tax=Sitodiplosis mosellana TaxID=263140 RepID=UPI00244409F4|nr:dual specificity protein kinase splB-like [Sitodiplosis mosellana]